MELATLLDRCRQGDALAWEALVRKYEARVYGMAMHYLRNSAEAQDASQDVFVRVWRHLGQGVGETIFVPWLLCLTRNASIDRLRRRKARRDTAELCPDATRSLAADAAGPEEATMAASRRKLVWGALGRLGHANREILLLKEIQGLDLQEIAQLLAVPLGTVKSRVHRARAELARHVLVLDPSYGD